MVCIQRPRGLYLHHLPINTGPLVPSWGNGVVMIEDKCGDSLASNIKALQLFLLFPRGQISTPPAWVYEYGDLHISIEGGSLQVSEQKQVLVKYLHLGTLVQTDKDVYKPGQTGEGQDLLEDLTGSWIGIPKFGSQALVLTPVPAFALSSENSNCAFGSKLNS